MQADNHAFGRRRLWMNTIPDVYLFGQVLGTHSFLLKDGFLQPDAYAEIGAQYFLPGGETGTAATVLDSLGVSVRMDGTWHKETTDGRC
jgi:hypothetical protein